MSKYLQSFIVGYQNNSVLISCKWPKRRGKFATQQTASFGIEDTIMIVIIEEEREKKDFYGDDGMLTKK